MAAYEMTSTFTWTPSALRSPLSALLSLRYRRSLLHQLPHRSPPSTSTQTGSGSSLKLPGCCSAAHRLAGTVGAPFPGRYSSVHRCPFAAFRLNVDRPSTILGPFPASFHCPLTASHRSRLFSPPAAAQLVISGMGGEKAHQSTSTRPRTSSTWSLAQRGECPPCDRR